MSLGVRDCAIVKIDEEAKEIAFAVVSRQLCRLKKKRGIFDCV